MPKSNFSFFNQVFKTDNQQITLPVLQEKKIALFIKREDLIHPFVSGNKFRKLKYNVLEAKRQNKKALLTFGGAFSNHIAATAFAGKAAGLQTIGVIRGEELGINLESTLSQNTTLQEAANNQMEFYFVDRESYRNKTDDRFIKKLQQKFGDFYLVPEGGTNELAVKGCKEILTEEDNSFDCICAAIGTGGTIAGLINSANTHQRVIGFPALKGDFLQKEIKQFVANKNNWSLNTNYHFGGYAKYNVELISFINQFYRETKIPLDPIYTGKMLFGILDLIKNNYFTAGTKILAIHTGGIQGVDGFNMRLAKKNQELITIS
ncbi:MAG: 1-aminocyclopropane-1-carboxylate deaminase/D-cysteine desulfhydrase [Flavobacteriaceae bacterium]|nr:1-aminocyclopropane-1-carboxylate deaminase/D-cysteine desulfhydrase [Flavobacteriaceae bacterium]